MINPMDFSGRTLGAILLVIGISCAFVAHYALLWKVGSWRLNKRLVIGIPGWGVASVFLWHGFTLLMSP